MPHCKFIPHNLQTACEWENVDLFLNRDVKQIHDMIQKVTSAEPY